VLAGVTKDQFTGPRMESTAIQLAFKTAIVGGMPDPKPSTDDVEFLKIDQTSRRAAGLSIQFTVAVDDPTKAAAILDTFLKDSGTNGFLTALKAAVEAQGLTSVFPVTGVTVTQSPTTHTSGSSSAPSSSSSSGLAGWAIALIVIACAIVVLGIVGGVVFAVFGRTHNKHEDNMAVVYNSRTGNEELSPKHKSSSSLPEHKDPSKPPPDTAL